MLGVSSVRSSLLCLLISTFDGSIGEKRVVPRWHDQNKVVVNPSNARALLESDRAALSSAQWTLQIAPTPNTKKKVTENSPRNGIGLHRSNFALFDMMRWAICCCKPAAMWQEADCRKKGFRGSTPSQNVLHVGRLGVMAFSPLLQDQRANRRILYASLA